MTANPAPVPHLPGRGRPKGIDVGTITAPEMSKPLEAFIRRGCTASANAMRLKGWERQLCDSVGVTNVDFLIMFGNDRDGRWRSKREPNNLFHDLYISRRWRDTLTRATEGEIGTFIARTVLQGLDYLAVTFEIPAVPPTLRALAHNESTED